jgi:soluble lytic murein transglycosylase-like protein
MVLGRNARKIALHVGRRRGNWSSQVLQAAAKMHVRGNVIYRLIVVERRMSLNLISSIARAPRWI